MSSKPFRVEPTNLMQWRFAENLERLQGRKAEAWTLFHFGMVNQQKAIGRYAASAQ